MYRKYFNPIRWIPKRSLCSVEKKVETAKSRVKNPRKVQISVKNQIMSYYGSSKPFMDHHENLSNGFFRGYSTPPHEQYCLSDAAAETIFQAIKNHLCPNTPIIETCPGLGLLTRRLLTLEPRWINAFEPNVYFKSVMDSIAAEHSKVLHVTNANFFSVGKEEFKDQLDGGNRQEIFYKGIQKQDWKSNPAVQLIAIITHNSILPYLNQTVTNQIGLSWYGRPKLFLIIPSHFFARINYKQLSLRAKYARNILFNIYYDYEILCEIDKDSFLPWCKNEVWTKKTNYIRKSNPQANVDNYVLIKAVAKEDLLDVVPPDLLAPLAFFVTQSMVKPKTKIIPLLENWMPNCGPLFISKGIGLFKDFSELSEKEFLDIFHDFSSSPDYATCSIHADVFSNLTKDHDEAPSENYETIEDDVEDNAEEPQEIDDSEKVL